MSKLIGKLSAAAIIAAGVVADGRGGRMAGRGPAVVPWAAVSDHLGGRRVSGLPSGVVTFLFTDIEASTRLVKALRERYWEVLAEHRRLVRAAIAGQAGYEVDSQGDAFFAAFDSAKQAVLCALEIQRALAGHQWPAGVLVRVRIGVHTGQAVPAGGAYTGLAVHRTARICAAAGGGQVLVSQPTQMIIEDEEEELGFTLADLGERKLKDLDRPVRLFQLAAPGLETRSVEQFRSGAAPGAFAATSRPGMPPRASTSRRSGQSTAGRGPSATCQTLRLSRTSTRGRPSRNCWAPSGTPHSEKHSPAFAAAASR